MKLVVDDARRDLHSRIHSAGHILSLAVRHLSEAGELPAVSEIKAQHYPDVAFVDFKGTIDGKFKDAIQAQCDKIVQEARPIEVCWYNEDELRENCAGLPEGFKVPEGKPARAISVKGLGAYPCGGTHVHDTSEVGKIIVRKISRSKGNSKVSYNVS